MYLFCWDIFLQLHLTSLHYKPDDWRDGWKSAFRDLCSVVCIFLPLLFTLPRGLCFSGFCQLLQLVSKAEQQQFRSTSVRCHRPGGWVLWAEWAPKRQLLVPIPVRCHALINYFWGEKYILVNKNIVWRVQRPRVPLPGPFPLLCGLWWTSPCLCHHQQKGKVQGWLLVPTARCLYSWGVQGCIQRGKRNAASQFIFFFPKLLFFQTLSGELAWWICKWLLDFINFKIIQGFAQSSKLSSAFPFLLVFL